MVITRKYVGTIFIILTFGMLFFNGQILPSSSSIASSDFFAQWRPDNQTLADNGCTSCHIANVMAPGSIDIAGSTDVYVYTSFELQLKVSSFSPAIGRKILIGFNVLDDDNSLFTNGKTYSIPYISVDGSGNSNYVTFSFKAPDQPGSYSLLMYAIFTRTSEYVNYLSKTVNINVSVMNDTTPPVINSLNVNGGAYSNNMTISGRTILSADVTDTNIGDVRFTTDNTTYTSMQMNSSTNLYDGNFTTGAFSTTSLVVTVSALDKGGNNVTSSYLFTLNNTGQLPDANIITFKVDQSINIHDGLIDPSWDDVLSTSITEFGSGGYIKTVQDGSYIYALLAYDASYKWISVQFNTSATNPDCMEDGFDSWVFGTDASGASTYFGDYHFVGTSAAPQLDIRSDVFFETITKDGMTYIELSRLLNTSDITGHDFTFTENNKFNVVLASSQDHTGSHTPLSWIVTDLSPVSGSSDVGPVTDLKNSLNLQDISDIVFVVSFVIVLVTVFIHISLRVVSKPIKHEKRIIYTSKLPNQPSSMTLIKNFFTKRKHKTVEEKK